MEAYSRLVEWSTKCVVNEIKCQWSDRGVHMYMCVVAICKSALYSFDSI